MAQDYYIILTTLGEAIVAAAIGEGSTITLTEMAVGDAEYTPSKGQTSLVNEQWRGALNSLYRDPENQNYVVAEAVIPTDVGGWEVREVGVFDNNGDLFAIGKYPLTYKPTLPQGSGKDLYIRFIMEVSSAAQVSLMIDPAVVLASRKYVDDALAALKAIMAKLTIKDHGSVSSGTVTLSYLEGSVHIVVADGDISIAFSDWPAAGVVQGNIMLVLFHGGNHDIDFIGVSWKEGSPPALTQTPELVTNGAFDGDTDWDKGTGWDIDSTTPGKAHCDGSQTGDSDLSQAGILTVEKTFRITFTVSGYVSGNIMALAGSAGAGTERSADGTYTEDIECSGSTDLILRADPDFVGDIDDVSVKEFKGSRDRLVFATEDGVTVDGAHAGGGFADV